jgi:hypothetical protein
MLSDEEKKALERIDYIQDFIIENGQYNADVNDMEYFSRIKNLIEKQSKEIEELKENKTLKNLQNDTNRLYIEMIERKNYFERELQKVKQSLLEKE